MDPHNARIVYHEIILVALARLALLSDDPWLHSVVRVAHQRSRDELLGSGAAALDDALEAHLITRTLGLDGQRVVSLIVNGMLPEGCPNALNLGAWLREEVGQLSRTHATETQQPASASNLQINHAPPKR